MGGYRSDGKVNSESLSNENSLEKTKENVKRLGILKVIGKSMLGKLKPGAKIAYEIKGEGEKYKKGDIIVYNLNGVNVVHEIVGYKDSNGKRTYTTKGVNNQYIDSDPVHGDNVIGKVVDLSKQELLGLTELVERGTIPYIEGLGISLSSGGLPHPITTLNNFPKFQKTLLKYGINEIDFMTDIMHGNDVNQLIQEYGVSYGVLQKIFKSYDQSKNLFDLRAKILDPILRDQLKKNHGYTEILKEIWKHDIRFIHQKGSSSLTTRRQRFEEYSKIIFGNIYEQELMTKWGIKGYNIDAQNLIDEVNSMYSDVIQLSKLVGIAETKNIWGKDAVGGITKNKILGWLGTGDHEFRSVNEEFGTGLIHIVLRHLDEFKDIFGLKKPRKMVNFIFKTISTSEGGYTYEKEGQVAYLIKYRGNYEYLIVGYDQNGNIHSAYPANNPNTISNNFKIWYNNFYIPT